MVGGLALTGLIAERPTAAAIASCSTLAVAAFGAGCGGQSQAFFVATVKAKSALATIVARGLARLVGGVACETIGAVKVAEAGSRCELVALSSAGVAAVTGLAVCVVVAECATAFVVADVPALAV